MTSLPTITRRNVHSTGYSYVVSIPKEWWITNGIKFKRGMKLVVIANKHILILNPKEADKIMENKGGLQGLSFQDVMDIIGGKK